MIERIEAELAALQREAPPETVERVRAVVAGLLELHRAGLSRVVELVGDERLAALAADEQVAPLLVLHDLHPLAPAERLRELLAERAPGARLELTGELARVIVRSPVPGLEQALEARAPELCVCVEVEPELIPAARLRVVAAPGRSG